MTIPSHAETLHWALLDALANWRDAHGDAREYARWHLRCAIAAIRRDDARRRAAFVAAVNRSKQRAVQPQSLARERYESAYRLKESLR